MVPRSMPTTLLILTLSRHRGHKDSTAVGLYGDPASLCVLRGPMCLSRSPARSPRAGCECSCAPGTDRGEPSTPRGRRRRPIAPASACSCASCSIRLASIGCRARSSRACHRSAGAPLPRSSRISSSSSFSANTSSSSAGGTCLAASAGPDGASPSSCRRYSIREIGWRSVRYASFRYDDRSRLARRSAGDGVVEIVRMKLPAERSETLLEIRGVDVQLPRQPEKAK